MSHAKISQALATAINLARDHAGNDERKQIKREMFAAAKAQFGIPDHIKVKAETRDSAATDYLLLKDARTGEAFALAPDGLWVNADRSTQAQATQATRWFEVGSLDDLVEAAKERVVSDGADWDGGSTTPPDAAENITNTLVVDPSGRVYVAMTEGELF